MTLREARERAGLSQRKLSEKINIRVETISKIENGASTKEVTLERICAALNVEVNEITDVTIRKYVYKPPFRK